MTDRTHYTLNHVFNHLSRIACALIVCGTSLKFNNPWILFGLIICMFTYKHDFKSKKEEEDTGTYVH